MNNKLPVPQDLIQKVYSMKSFDETLLLLENLSNYNIVNNEQHVFNIYKLGSANILGFYNVSDQEKKQMIHSKVTAMLKPDVDCNLMLKSVENNIFYSIDLKFNEMYVMDKVEYDPNACKHFFVYIEKVLMRHFQGEYEEVHMWQDSEDRSFNIRVQSPDKNAIQYVQGGVETLIDRMFAKIQLENTSYFPDTDVDKYVNIYKNGQLHEKLNNLPLKNSTEIISKKKL